jgi:FLVCR family feline leukemia virus subgroup C receptor-related protein
MVIGTMGAIGFSLYIKKTFNYSKAVKAIALGSPIMLALLCIWLNTANVKIGTAVLTSLMGFILTPVVPLSYDLGCELAFPMGEAQVTGLLNGGAMLWAFTSSSLVTATIGFGTTHKSFLTMVVLFVFILGGAFLFFSVKMDLKRQEYEKRSKSQKISEMSDSPTK